jgi:DNA-binding NarL/FixJ family response regulator
VARLGSGIPLIARERELETLAAALRRAGDGAAGAVLLAGDAGVGKSRLLAELIASARADGATVLTGRCLDVDEGGLPYLPFVEALGQLSGPGRELLGRWPVLNRLLPGLAETEPAAAGDQAMERLRLFDAVYGLLGALAEDGRVMLALEDLHWADASTRDLLLFLLSRLDTQRLLVVATYRVDDLHRRHPLWPLLGELARLPAVERIELAPFTPADAVTFVSSLAENELPDSTVRAIAKRAEGNAFFCEELTAAHRRGADVATGLADLLLARVERLSREAQGVVRTVSGAGYTLRHPTLRAMCELDEDDLEHVLREAVWHNILVAGENGYTFRHALLREAVYEDLLPGERVRLHAGYARIAAENGTVASLAYHSFQSHDLPTALSASVRAARQAEDMRAPGRSLHHLEQALQLWDVVADAETVSDTDEVALLRSASAMAMAIGEVDRAITFARSAVAKADRRDDPELAADTRHQLASALIPLDMHRDEVSAAVDGAWELVRERPPSEVRAKVLALRARGWVWGSADASDPPRLRRHAKRAIDDARQIGAGAVEADGLVTLAALADYEGDHQESIRLGTEAAERAAAIGAFGVELRARHNLSAALLKSAWPREAIRRAADTRRRAEELGLGWSEFGITTTSDLIFVRYLVGDWTDGLAAADLSGAPRLAWARVSAEALHILVAQGRFERIDQIAGQLGEQDGDPRTATTAGIALAEGALWRGNLAESVERSRAVAGRWGALARPGVLDALWMAAVALSALADLADQARQRGDDAAAEAAVAGGERLHAESLRQRASVTSLQRAEDERRPDGQALGRRVEAELNRLRGQDDPAAWRRAVDDSSSVPYWRAIARWRLAAALLAAGDREEATEQLRAARVTAVELGAEPLREALDALARRGRIGATQPEPGHILTPRERSVLELVATGLTNKQIGTRLYISEKTASVHLSRIMAKLDAASRTEAVSIAHSRGLLDFSARPL